MDKQAPEAEPRTVAGRGPRRRWTDQEQRLLDVLEKAFFAEGFAHLTIADIGALLKVSRNTVYKLAPSKQELIELVIDRMFRHMGKAARAALEAAGDPAERVAAYLGAGTQAVQAGSLAFTRDLEANPGTRAIYDRHQAIGMKVLTGLIEDGVRSGRFRHVQAMLIMQVVDAAHIRLRDPDVLTALCLTHAQAIDQLIAVVLSGIEMADEARPPPVCTPTTFSASGRTRRCGRRRGSTPTRAGCTSGRDRRGSSSPGPQSICRGAPPPHSRCFRCSGRT